MGTRTRQSKLQSGAANNGGSGGNGATPAAARLANAAPAESERDTTGRFAPGSSGNPQGRPMGSRSRATMLVECLLNQQAEALAGKAIEIALRGDVLALRLCLERLLPACRERPMVLELPAPANSDAIASGFTALTEALSHGELTPAETDSAAALLEGARRALETIDLARRIEELEKRVEEAEEDAR